MLKLLVMLEVEEIFKDTYALLILMEFYELIKYNLQIILFYW